MDVVGKIERRRARRQVDNVPFWGKDVHPIVKDLAAHFVEHLAGVGHLFLPRNQLAQPGNAVFVARTRSAGRAFFVFPVRGHAQLGVLVHLFGADLNLDRFAARAKHNGMDRLIAVRFGVGDIVIELIGQMTEVSVYYPQRGVAVLQTLRHDTHGAHVKQLVKREVFLLHFAPDAVDMLRPAVDFGAHVLFFHRLAQAADKFVDIMLAVDTALMQEFGNTFIFRRVQIAEAVIFQLPLQLTNP